MAVALLYLSVMSNFMAVSVVLLCLFAMIGYIYRLRGDLNFSSSVVMVHQPCIKRNMIRVEIPFSLELTRADSHSIRCKITTNSPCHLQTFWSVNVTDLHSVFSWPWEVLRHQLLDSESGVLTDSSLFAEPVKTFQDMGEFFLVLKQPENFDPSNIGPVPRTKYPVGIIMLSDSSDQDIASVVAMLTVIHIEDSVCTTKTCILYQYLKQANGHISNLKPLYFSSSEENCEVVDEPRSSCTCIVCQLKPVSMALLPCRHTCICDDCFTKLDKCPLCRSAITSYFHLQNSVY